VKSTIAIVEFAVLKKVNDVSMGIRERLQTQAFCWGLFIGKGKLGL